MLICKWNEHKKVINWKYGITAFLFEKAFNNLAGGQYGNVCWSALKLYTRTHKLKSVEVFFTSSHSAERHTTFAKPFNKIYTHRKNLEIFLQTLEVAIKVLILNGVLLFLLYFWLLRIPVIQPSSKSLKTKCGHCWEN